MKKVNKQIIKIAILQAFMIIIMVLMFISVFIDIENMQQENTFIKNELNHIQSKIRILEVIDEKLYVHVDTLGSNDLMIKSWIEEINCYLYSCSQETSYYNGQAY